MACISPESPLQHVAGHGITQDAAYLQGRCAIHAFPIPLSSSYLLTLRHESMHLLWIPFSWANLDGISQPRDAVSSISLSTFAFLIETHNDMQRRSVVYRSPLPVSDTSTHPTFASPITGLPGQDLIPLSHLPHLPPR